MSEPLHPFSAAALPSSADPVAESAALYATEVAELLFNLLVDVVRERAPDAEAVHKKARDASWVRLRKILAGL